MKKKKVHGYVRAVIQLFFFVFFPSIYTSAFSGIKYVFTNLGAKAPIELSGFLTILIVISIYTIVFGRFFCGYACAFGSLGDAVRALYVWICRKIKKKPVTVNRKAAGVLQYGKYLILAVIVCLCFSGIYGTLTGWNPWDVFSMTHAGNFAYSTYKTGVVLMILILVLMAVSDRGFCRFLCPMGAWFALLPVFPFFAVKRDKKACIPKCRACLVRCPADIDIPQTGSWTMKGDCFACGKCIDICPKKHIGCGGMVLGSKGDNETPRVSKLKGNEIIFSVIRAVILLLVMIWVGV